MNLPVWAVTIFQTTAESIIYTGSSRLMQISLLRISLLRFFKTITKILWAIYFVTAYIK